MNKQKPRVSIIIPVYNNGLFLKDTLSSIQKQTFDNFEAIVINDGSVDNSEEIIDQFVKADKRFIKITQENKGVSEARNAGLKIVKGNYVTFVDGDDTLPIDALQEMDNIARNYPSDLIIGGIQRVDGSLKKVNQRTKRLKDKRELLKGDLDLVHGLSLCNKWFLKEIIDKNNLRLEPFKHLEDGVFLYNFLQYTENIQYCDAVIYNYLKRVPTNASSVTQTVKSGLLESALKAYERIAELTADYKEEFKQELAYRINSTTLIGDYYKKIWSLDEKDEELLVSYMEKLWEKESEDHKAKTFSMHKGLELEKGFRTKDELLKDTIFTIVISPLVSESKINIILKSIYGQSVPGFCVILDQKFQKETDESFKKMKNLSFIDLGKDCKEWIASVEDITEPRYLMILDQNATFDYDTLTKAYVLMTTNKDVFVQMNVLELSETDCLSDKVFDFQQLKDCGTNVEELYRTKTCMIQKDAPLQMIKNEEIEKKDAAIKTPKPSVISKAKRAVRKILAPLRKSKKEEVKVKKGAAVLDYYFHDSVDENIVLLEGIGKNIKGNILYIVKELKKEKYGDLRIFVAVNDGSRNFVQAMLKQQEIEGVQTVDVGGKKYKELLATAKYLVNEVYFPNYWVKKPEQCYINIWHGTPLKKLGAGKPGGMIHGDGPAQKNFISADYILFPNEFTEEKLLKDCYVDNLVLGKSLMLGYPRTGKLMEQIPAVDGLREKLAGDKKHLVAYMPTYRDNDEDGKQIEKIKELFEYLDENLPEDSLIYVNLHHKMDGEIEYTKYKNIKEFPKDLDTYEVLSVIDCLVTDYSSLMFDYGATGKNVVLYCYDLEEYIADRGLYLDINSLPFAQARTPQQLIEALKAGKQYDDTTFLDTFCKYDSDKNAEKLCELMVLGNEEKVVIKTENTKPLKPVLVYSDGWHPCKATDQIYKLSEKQEVVNKVYLSYKEAFVNNYLDSAYPLLNRIKSVGTKGEQLFTDEQKKIKRQYRAGKMSFEEMMKDLENAYQTEKIRCYDQLSFEKVFLYDTVDADKIIGFSYFDCPKYLCMQEDLSELVKNENQYILDAIRHFEKCGGVLVTDGIENLI